MASYEVGYGKPPSSGRFRAGVSGNPRGRPKPKAARARRAHQDRAQRADRVSRAGKNQGRDLSRTDPQGARRPRRSTAISTPPRLVLKIGGSRGALRRSGPRPDSGGELDRRPSWSDRRPENRRSRGRARRHACRMVVVVREMNERASSRCPFHRQPAGVAYRSDSCTWVS